MTSRKLRPELGHWVQVTSGPDKGTHGLVVRIGTADNGRPVYLVRPAGQRTARPYPLRSLTVRAVQLDLFTSPDNVAGDA